MNTAIVSRQLSDKEKQEYLRKGETLYLHEVDDPVIHSSWLESLVEKGVIQIPISIKNAEIEGSLNLKQIKFEQAVSITDSVFNGEVDFSDANFESSASFARSFFKENVEFSSVSVQKLCDFRAAHFEKIVRFINTEFKDQAVFLNSQFYNDAVFNDSHFLTAVTFAGAQFKMSSSFTRIHADGNIVFSPELTPGQVGDIVHFGNEISFCDAHIQGEADFRSAQFQGDAIFDKIHFGSPARFESYKKLQCTSFGREASFNAAIFDSGAFFFETRFVGDAVFQRAHFNSTAEFDNANFEGNADFMVTKFDSEAFFLKTRFVGDAVFQHAHFNSTAEFDNANFEGDADFMDTKSDYGIYFIGSTFHKNALFKNACISSIFFRETISKEPYALFNWNNIPGEDDKKLKRFLTYKFGADWIENAMIKKIEHTQTIKIINERNFILLRLNDEKTSAILETDDDRTEILTAKTERGKLNLYQPQFLGQVVKLQGWNGENMSVAWGELKDKMELNDLIKIYMEIEPILRKSGNDSKADDIYYDYRKAKRRNLLEEKNYGRYIWDSMYYFFAGYGVKPYRISFLLLVFLIGGTVIFHLPGAVTHQVASLQAADPYQISWLEAMSVSMNQLFLGNIPWGSDWKPTEKTALYLPFSFYASILHLASSFLLAILIAFIKDVLHLK